MTLSTDNLILAPNANIDLQLHTVYSDGQWIPESLIDHLKQEGFSLAAITDHDRPDMAIEYQKLAIEKNFPLLVAVEMTCQWRGKMTDVLCYGFDLNNNHLIPLAETVAQKQRENSQQIFDHLKQNNIVFEDKVINSVLAKPNAAHLNDFFALLASHPDVADDNAAVELLRGGGFKWAMSDIADVVEATHKSGGICLVAHPGRDDGFVCYDTDLLDELRAETPIDGLEAHYPKHSQEQIVAFSEYAEKHNLFVSSGSDSHDEKKTPIKYHAHLSQKLLERLGIQFE